MKIVEKSKLFMGISAAIILVGIIVIEMCIRDRSYAARSNKAK